MNFAELLIDLATGTNAIIRSTASKFNLTSSQIFSLLSIPFDGVPMSSLAHKMGLDNSTLTRNIQKLEYRGLVRRQKDSYDRRIYKLFLTDSGTALIQSIDDSLETKSLDVLNKINLDDQEHLLTALEGLAWAINCTREGQ